MCFFYLLFAKAYTVVVITIYVWDKVFFKKKKKKDVSIASWNFVLNA